MKGTTIFFADKDKEVIQEEAQRQRESFSSFVRKACLIRAGALETK